MRRCEACEKELARRETEKRAEFLRRRYCDWNCSVAGRTKKAQERRLALDMQDVTTPHESASVEFNRADLLRVAKRAAPQVPIALLADVLDAVEPLIAATTRRRLMAHVGHVVRRERESDD